MSKNADALNDCFATDRDRLTHSQALSTLRERLVPQVRICELPLLEASGRISANPVRAMRNVPACDNSAVDGYAFAHASLTSTPLAVTQRVTANGQDPSPLAESSAARIFTGAPMPAGADTVAMQEDCIFDVKRNEVDLPAKLKPGANRRLAGEDVQIRQQIVAKGHRLRPQDLAAIASIGQDRVEVFQTLKVGLLSSGDELVAPGQTANDAQVYNSNTTLLCALLSKLPVSVNNYGIVADNQSAVHEALRQAATENQVIISTGGASRGEEDHFVNAYNQLGTCHMWQIAVKPGRPLAFGQIDNTLCLGLPGNPVASFVCFLLYAYPMLLRLCGGEFVEPQKFGVPAAFTIANKKPDRREFWRGFLVHGENGAVAAQKYMRDGSGLISGLTAASGLIEVAEHVTSIREGELVSFLPFSQFGIL